MQWSAGLVNPLLPFICSFTGGIHHQATYCSSPVASSIWPPPLSYSGTAFFPQCYHKNTFSRMELNCYSTCSKQASKAPPQKKVTMKLKIQLLTTMCTEWLGICGYTFLFCGSRLLRLYCTLYQILLSLIVKTRTSNSLLPPPCGR